MHAKQSTGETHRGVPSRRQMHVDGMAGSAHLVVDGWAESWARRSTACIDAADGPGDQRRFHVIPREPHLALHPRLDEVKCMPWCPPPSPRCALRCQSCDDAWKDAGHGGTLQEGTAAHWNRSETPMMTIPGVVPTPQPLCAFGGGRKINVFFYPDFKIFKLFLTGSLKNILFCIV